MFWRGVTGRGDDGEDGFLEALAHEPDGHLARHLRDQVGVRGELVDERELPGLEEDACEARKLALEQRSFLTFLFLSVPVVS